MQENQHSPERQPLPHQPASADCLQNPLPEPSSMKSISNDHCDLNNANPDVVVSLLEKPVQDFETLKKH
jgi:hypothetical protein